MSDYNYEILDFVRECEQYGWNSFADDLLKQYTRIEFSGRFILPVLEIFSERMTPSPFKFYFAGRRLADVLQFLPHDKVNLIGNLYDFLFCKRYGFAFKSNQQIIKYVTQLLSSHRKHGSFSGNLLSVPNPFGELTSGLLIVSNDSLPAERALISLARTNGLKTICVQDGLFQRSSPSHFFHGRYADHMFVINTHQKNILIEKGVPSNKIEVMGFYKNIPETQNLPPLRTGNERRICILGQAWRSFSLNLVERYLDLINLIEQNLKHSGYTFFFKPHPGEKNANYLHKFNRLYNKSFYQALKDFDVFLALSSTALMEATLSGRVAIQILDPVFFADDFSQSGYSYSLPANNLSPLPELIRDSSPFTAEWISQSSSRTATERFLNVLTHLHLL